MNACSNPHPAEETVDGQALLGAPGNHSLTFHFPEPAAGQALFFGQTGHVLMLRHPFYQEVAHLNATNNFFWADTSWCIGLEGTALKNGTRG
jgi:hypothetical protein